MDHPDYLSSTQMSALLEESRALTADQLEEFRSRDDRAVVQIHALPSSFHEPERQRFCIVSVRGEIGDRCYQQTNHGTIDFEVFDDGYNDAVLVTLNITSPLNQR